MNPDTIPVGQSAEISGGSAPTNLPGAYYHAGAKKRLFALNTPQGDAFVRLGFKWERPLTEEDLAVPAQGVAATAVLDTSPQSQEALAQAQEEAAKSAQETKEQLVRNANLETAKARSGGTHTDTTARVDGSAESLEASAQAEETQAEEEPETPKKSSKKSK